MFQGKCKALTFSFDDGVEQDKRMIEILNRYGMKGTFNLNSGLFGRENDWESPNGIVTRKVLQPYELEERYRGHEVAVHTLTHPNLTECSDEEVIRQVEEDRKNLEKLVGYDVVGMAYPCGGVNHDERVAKLIQKHTKIKYVRTITSTYSFEPQDDLYCFNPTAYQYREMDQLFELGERLLKSDEKKTQIFYVWGHCYELDANGSWGEFERFCKMMSGKDDIFYGTNREVLLSK